MSWTKRLHNLEILIEDIEQAEDALSNTEHYIRIALANQLARAREALEALSNDELKEER